VALLRAVLLFSAIEVIVRITDLPRAARWLGTRLEFSERPPGGELHALDIDPAKRRSLVMLGRVARHWPFGPRGACLRLSLAAATVLRSRAPTLRLAIGPSPSIEVTAHAWLEVDGIAVTDPGRGYVPLLEHGGPRLQRDQLQRDQ
jgi:hypothetical protein